MGQITLSGVTKRFGGHEVIPPLDLEIGDGEFVVFVGPSGCGKSTLLRLIAGLEDTSGGRVLINGNDATTVPPARRGIAMVFQSYALYPQMSVRSNIGFPLKMAGMARGPRDRRVEAAAAMIADRNVTWFGVIPVRVSADSTGRSNCWKRGFNW